MNKSVTLLAFVMLVQASGHKGPLYLPEHQQSKEWVVGTLNDAK